MKKIKSTTEQLIFTKEETLNLALGFRVVADNCFSAQERLKYFELAYMLESRYFERPLVGDSPERQEFDVTLDQKGNTEFLSPSESLITKINQAITLFNYTSTPKVFVNNEN